MRLRNVKGAQEAIDKSPYVIHSPADWKGKWQEAFPSPAPLQIEIGMGKGRFLMEMAALHPDTNYIGIERYSSVLYRGLQKMEEEPVPNVFFLCEDATNLEEIFAPEEVGRIFLNFSDPWPKDRHAKRRLTSRFFLQKYEKFLSQDGLLEFKTDNTPLFDFSLEEFKEEGWQLLAFTYDLHHDSEMNRGNVMTEYEERFSAKGNPIHKLVAKRPAEGRQEENGQAGS